jgi:hypothetical protein
MPPKYFLHSADTDSFIKAIQALYETVLISKSIVICVNDTDVMECVAQLNDCQFSASPLFSFMLESNTELRNLSVFKKCPNHLLVMTYDVFQRLDDKAFQHYLMETQWNALFGNNVPSYHMDAIAEKIQNCHKKGFWEENGTDEFHLMYYLN